MKILRLPLSISRPSHSARRPVPRVHFHFLGDRGPKARPRSRTLLGRCGPLRLCPRGSACIPSRVIRRHPHHQPGDRARRPWSPPASPGTPVIFLRDQLTIPAQDGVRGDNAGEPRKHLAPELLAAHRKPSPLRIGESDSFAAKLFSEHPVLLSQVVDRVLLLAVEPPRRGQDEELESLGHPASLPERDAEGEGLVPRILGLRLINCTIRGQISWAQSIHSQHEMQCI